MEVTPAIQNQILTDWQMAPRGTKQRVLQKWADLLGCTTTTLYRNIPRGMKAERKKRTGVAKIPGLEKYAMAVTMIKRRPPKGKRFIITEQAIQLAADQGLIPEEARKIPAATYNAKMRQMGLTQKKEPTVRFQADYPNQLHHIDASGSDCFYVAKRLPDGDAVLKLDTRPYKGYKNKPVKTDDRDRLWIYGLVDDYSGMQVARYVAAPGESCVDNLDFLGWAWAKTGLPDFLKADHGPMMKDKAALNLIDRLSVDIDPSMPGASQTHGKIERPWRTLWQRFETPFYAENHKTFEIRLSELSQRFANYIEAYNQMPHRYERKMTRFQMWQRVNLRGGIIQMPENAIRTSAKRYKRTVEADGCFWLHNIRYEVKGLHNARVYVYEGLFDDRLVVRDKNTGEKYEVERFQPLSYGQYKARPETPAQKVAKEAKQMQVQDEDGNSHDLRNTLYLSPKEQGNVRTFPTLVKEKRQVEDILDVNTYRSVEDAIKDFSGISGIFMDDETRSLVKEEIINHGLNKTFVKELALEVRAENERSIYYG